MPGRTSVERLRRASREDAIEGDGFGSSTRDLVRTPRSFLALLVLAILLLAAGCGGGGEEAQPLPTKPPATGVGTADGSVAGGGMVGGSTAKSGTSAETSKNIPFTLNQQQPVPPDFRAAYQRKAFIVVEFLKTKADSSRGVDYPQGIGPDERVDKSLRDLRGKYPQIEFFSYDIDKPGNATTGEDLGRGEYGTLAAQLKVGYTPFVAMLAPRGDQYVIENLFRGYVEQGVLDQALFDLSSTDVRGNSTSNARTTSSR